MGFMTINFDLASASQDYSSSPAATPRPMSGESELAGWAFSYLVDWGSDVFPDALTPTANAHHIIFDTPSPSNHTSIMRDDYTTSFWTVDGRNPSPWQDWQDIVYEMLDLFGLFAVDDVGPASIDITSPLPWNTTLAPQATVTNFGTVIETFDVTCEIDPGAYSSTETVTDLAAGDSIQVTFTPDFTFAMEDTYTVTVFTELPGDMDTSNDTLVALIATYDPGIAEDGSVTPAVFDFGVSTISRGAVSIRFALPTATKVELTVYDALGRLLETVVSKKFSAGNHSIDVQPDLPAGIYFYNIETGVDNATEKVILVD
jgi:hypothetical protein